MNTVYMAKDAKRLVDKGEDVAMPIQANKILKDWFNKQAGYVETAKFINISTVNITAAAAITGVDDLIEYAMGKNYKVQIYRTMLKASQDNKYNREAYNEKEVYYLRLAKITGPQPSF